jgi:hypothetical protein
MAAIVAVGKSPKGKENERGNLTKTEWRECMMENMDSFITKGSDIQDEREMNLHGNRMEAVHRS